MAHKFTVNPNGILVKNRMRPYTPGQANLNPARKVSRIKQLMQRAQPRICLVRGEGLGDVIMMTPAIHALRESFNNDVELTVATNTRYLDGALPAVLQGNPDIDHIIDRDQIDESYFDTVLNMHCPAQKYEVPGCKPRNRIDIFADHVGVKLTDTTPKFYITKEEVREGREYLFSIGIKPTDKIIVVNIFSSSQTRTMDNYVAKNALMELGQTFGYRMIILTHSTDYPSDILWNNIPYSTVLHEAGVRKIASILVNSDLLLCPDSGILHLAGALGVPTVAIFGPTDPRARINHYPNSVAIWHGEEMQQCKPCWYGTCPTNYLCLRSVTTEDIVESCITHNNRTSRVNSHRLINMSNQSRSIDSEVL